MTAQARTAPVVPGELQKIFPFIHLNDAPAPRLGKVPPPVAALEAWRPLCVMVLTMSQIIRLAALVLIAMVFVGGGTKAMAQTGAAQEVHVDCSAFRRKSDGSWIALRGTTIKIGTNSITVSGGRVQGSVNGLSLQDAIAGQCAKRVPPKAGGGIYADTNWIRSSQSVSECLAHARELVQDFPEKSVAGETVFAWSDGYTFIVRCTPQKVIFFALVGPADGTPERNQDAQRQLDRIFDKW